MNETTANEKPIDRLERQVDAWLEHCREVGHIPLSEGGKATYDGNYSHTLIRCWVKGCQWEIDERD